VAILLVILIEDPRSKLRGIFDPQKGIFIFMLANPAASRGECARGDSNTEDTNIIKADCIGKKPSRRIKICVKVIGCRYCTE